MASRLVIVTGMPASGKTTLARAIARRYRAALLEKDTVKEALFDALGAADAAASRRLSTASFTTLIAQARSMLGCGTDLILEGNFRALEHRAALEALLASAAGVRCAQLLCRIAEPLRRARLAARPDDPARHPGHRDAELARMPAAAGDETDRFVDIPGERLLVDCASDASSSASLRVLDDWWRAGA